jgi:tetratricopeptide (TPR) repeat protein
MYNNIKELVSSLSSEPHDAELNFKIAVEYENIGQNASAISFYLRAAEYGVTKEIVYSSLIKVGICLERQGERDWNVSNSFLQAIEHDPERPEAYYKLSKFYEKTANWQECHTFAELGLVHANKELAPLPVDVGYVGVNALQFQKGLSAWWLDRQSESLDVFIKLGNLKELDPAHRSAVHNSLKTFNVQLDKIAIVLPVRDNGTGRAQRLIKCLNSWSKVTEGLSDVHIIIDSDDTHNFEFLNQHINKFSVTIQPPELTLMEKINTVGPELAKTYKYIMFVGDDLVFKTMWETEFIEYLSSVPAGLVYGNTLDLPDHIDWGTHPCITTNMVRALGFYGCPAVAHNFFDNFWSEVAKELGTEKFMPDIIMDHRRTGWTPDTIYHKVTGLLESDREKYTEYKTTRFREDLQKIKDYINAG